MNRVDDPIWEYVLHSKLQPYIPFARKFWEVVTDIDIISTGVFSVNNELLGIEDEQVPPGLMYRVTNTPVRSPIKNIQVFPLVPTSYLQLTNVAGGATKMVKRVCADRKFKIDEFTIIEKSNLPSTYNQGQFIAFIPTSLLEANKVLGKWVYMTYSEMLELSSLDLPSSIKLKIEKYIYK